MPSDSRKIFDAFIRQEPVARIASFEDWLGACVTSVLNLDLSQIDGYVENQKRRLWGYIKSEISEFQAHCRIPLFSFVDDDKMLFLNRQFDLHKTPKSYRDVKLGYRWAITNFIDQLDWRQYEALGAVAAHLFGAERVALTPRGNEGGVDLYAVIPNRGQTNIFHGPYAYYRVVGQSKRYADPVAVGKTREFIHVLETVRHQSSVMHDKIPNWFRSCSGPVIGWMNAHAGFQSGSIDIAHDHGLIVSDTLTLCESLLLVRSTPVTKSADELREYFARRIIDQLKP